MFDALASWLIYELAGLEGTAFGAAAHFFVMDVTKILVLLTLVIYAMGLLRAVLYRGAVLCLRAGASIGSRP